jgi:hypothetical protein
MVLNERLASATSMRTLSVQKFSIVLNVTGRQMQPHGVTNNGPTPKNGCDGWSFPIGIYNFLKAARLVRLRAAPPSIKTWYSLTLEMVRETSSGSCLAPAMLLGQSEAMNLIGVSIHLRCSVAFGAKTATAISRRRVLTTCLDVMA